VRCGACGHTSAQVIGSNGIPTIEHGAINKHNTLVDEFHRAKKQAPDNLRVSSGKRPTSAMIPSDQPMAKIQRIGLTGAAAQGSFFPSL
jgi:hypothetical protein